MAKKWVRLNRDYQLRYTPDRVAGLVVPEGTVGFVLPKTPRNKFEWENVKEGFVPVKFPHTHGWTFPLDALDELEVLPVNEAINIIREYEGHHTSNGQFQFNIKMYGRVNVPEEAEKILTQEQIQQVYDSACEDNLRCLVDKGWCDGVLSDDFDWVDEKKWHQAGRMGGWLILTNTYGMSGDKCVDSYEDARYSLETDAERMKEYVEQCDVEKPVSFEVIDRFQRDIDKSLHDLQSEISEISDLARDLQMIDTIIERHKEGIYEYLATMEPYEQYMPDFYAFVDYDSDMGYGKEFYVERRDRTSNQEYEILGWFYTYEEALEFARTLDMPITDNVKSLREAIK